MNQRDLELLDKELWGRVSPSPPRSGDIIGAVFVTAFLAGIAIGGVLFTHDSKQTQIASHDAVAAISLLNGVPPVREQLAR
jgi:predicted MFS family arabinose efflux permease